MMRCLKLAQQSPAGLLWTISRLSAANRSGRAGSRRQGQLSRVEVRPTKPKEKKDCYNTVECYNMLKHENGVRTATCRACACAGATSRWAESGQYFHGADRHHLALPSVYRCTHSSILSNLHRTACPSQSGVPQLGPCALLLLLTCTFFSKRFNEADPRPVLAEMYRFTAECGHFVVSKAVGFCRSGSTASG